MICPNTQKMNCNVNCKTPHLVIKIATSYPMYATPIEVKYRTCMSKVNMNTPVDVCFKLTTTSVIIHHHLVLMI